MLYQLQRATAHMGAPCVCLLARPVAACKLRAAHWSVRTRSSGCKPVVSPVVLLARVQCRMRAVLYQHAL
jgi:hypothetical protein